MRVDYIHYLDQAGWAIIDGDHIVTVEGRLFFHSKAAATRAMARLTPSTETPGRDTK